MESAARFHYRLGYITIMQTAYVGISLVFTNIPVVSHGSEIHTITMTESFF
jgi:hypothetical protein